MTDEALLEYFYNQISGRSNGQLLEESVEVSFNLNVQQQLSISGPLFSAVSKKYKEAAIGLKVNAIVLVIQGDFHSLIFDSFPHRVRIDSQKFVVRDGARLYYPVNGNELIFRSQQAPNRKFIMRNIDLTNCDIGKVEINVSVDKVEGFASKFGMMSISNGNSFIDKITVREIDILGGLGAVEVKGCISDTISISMSPNENASGNRPDDTKILKFGSIKSDKFKCQLSNNYSISIDGSELNSFQLKALTLVGNIELKGSIIPEIEITSPFPPSSIDQIILRDILHTTDARIKTLLGNEDYGMRSNIGRVVFRNVTIKKDSTWEIKNFNGISSLVLIDILNKGELIFRNISFLPAKPQKIDLDRIPDKIDSIFTERSPEDLMKDSSGLYLLGSRFGSTSFINSDLPDVFHVYEVDVSGLRLINTGFPKSIKPLNYRNSLRNKLEALQQFRKNADSYGDKEVAAIYRSAELDIRLRQISDTPKSIVANLDEILSLWLNKVSNNHGQNWLVTLVVLFLYGYISYGIFLESIGFDVRFNIDGILLVNSQIEHFFDYIVPGFLGLNKDKIQALSDALHVPKEKVQTGMPKICILFNDVIALPYLIFQLVTAFRKHVVK